MRMRADWASFGKNRGFRSRFASKYLRFPSLGAPFAVCLFPRIGVCFSYRERNEGPASHRKVRTMTKDNFIGKQASTLPRLDLAEENLLIARARRDADAMAEICGRYEPLALRAAHQQHLATVREEAESVAHLALVEAVRGFDAGLGIPFAAFAREKVYGDVRTFFRRECSKWRHEYVPVDRGEDELSFWDCVADPQDAAGQTELRDDMHAALARLTDKERAVVLLLLQENLTQTQIAQVLGIAVPTVAKRKKTAFRKLRAVLS